MVEITRAATSKRGNHSPIFGVGLIDWLGGFMSFLKKPLILDTVTDTKEKCRTAFELAIDLSMNQRDRLICFQCPLPNSELRQVLAEIDQRECTFYKPMPESNSVTVCHKVVNDYIMG